MEKEKQEAMISAGREADPEALFGEAREAEKSGQQREALRIYSHIVDTLGDNSEAAETVSLARGLKTALLSVLGHEPEDHGDDKNQFSRREQLRKPCIRNATRVIEAWHGSSDERTALENALGKDTAATIVGAIKIESNFNIVNTWRIGTKYG